MRIDVVVQTEPLSHSAEIFANCGAVVRFEGRVRPDEKGSKIEALNYEAYLPMAQTQMEKILVELGKIHPCLSVRVRHRVGTVPVGEASILVEVFAEHRAEAFALASAFMDRLKQDVPIWKIGTVAAKT
jgi:molybdopterin synthase catalytic subunit